MWARSMASTAYFVIIIKLAPPIQISYSVVRLLPRRPNSGCLWWCSRRRTTCCRNKRCTHAVSCMPCICIIELRLIWICTLIPTCVHNFISCMDAIDMYLIRISVSYTKIMSEIDSAMIDYYHIYRYTTMGLGMMFSPLISLCFDLIQQPRRRGSVFHQHTTDSSST